MTDQLRNSKDQPSTDAEENPILEIEVSEKSTRIDVPYTNSDNDEIVVRELAKDFNEAFSKWEHNAARAESYLTSRQPSMQINEDERTFDLNFLSKQVNEAYERLPQVQTPDQDIVRKIDTCNVVTRSLQKKLESYLSSRELLNNDVRQSVRSKISCRSNISRRSTKSSILSVKRADAAADLAAKQIELDAFQAKAKHKEETARLEAELARRKAQLEQMEIKEQIQIANARLKVYQEIDKEEEARFVDNQSVAEDVDERNRELKQTRRRRQRERHLKMKLHVSAIISQLFKVIMLEKCVLTILELDWNQRFRGKETKLNICHHMLTSSTQLQSRSFHVVERTRTSSKCPKLKNARAKRAEILFFIVRYANL